jgi:hypothetical protein
MWLRKWLSDKKENAMATLLNELRTEDRFQDKTHKFHDKSKLGSSDKIISKELTHTLIQDDI